MVPEKVGSNANEKKFSFCKFSNRAMLNVLEEVLVIRQRQEFKQRGE